MYTVKIDNAYSDGHESSHEVLVDPPEGTLEEWFEDVVWPHTGDGHGTDNDLGTCFVATIIACDVEAHLGEQYEWTSS